MRRMLAPHNTWRTEIIRSDNTNTRPQPRNRRLKPTRMKPEIIRAKEQQRTIRGTIPGIYFPGIVTNRMTCHMDSGYP